MGPGSVRATNFSSIELLLIGPYSYGPPGPLAALTPLSSALTAAVRLLTTEISGEILHDFLHLTKVHTTKTNLSPWLVLT